MIESGTLFELEKEVQGLRNINEELLNRVEMLQKNRFSIVEELVYQRWLNACLKFEIHKYQNPSSSIRRRPTVNLKVSESTNNSCSDGFLSSPASSGDGKEFGTSNSYSSSTNHMKLNLLKKVRSWRSKNKEESINVSLVRRSSLIRRFSTSMISYENKGQAIQDSTQAPRKRRVSFNDSVKTFRAAFQEDVELCEVKCLGGKEMDDDCTSSVVGDESLSSYLRQEGTPKQLGSNRNDLVEIRKESEVQIDHEEKSVGELTKLIDGRQECKTNETFMKLCSFVFIFLLITLVLILTFGK